MIFVAVLAAWGVYMVPKVRQQRAHVSTGKVGDAVSRSLRILARRDAVAGDERLVTSSADYSLKAVPDAAPAPVPTARREAARRAARRRRRVLGALVILLLTNAGLVEWTVVSPWSLIAPVTLIAAWLVACRMMVRKERPMSILRPAAAEADAEAVSVTAQVELALDEDGAPIDAQTDSWTPVSVPLPSYVDAAVAQRSVRTIDLDATGVFSAGHNEADSALAREAELVRARIAERQQQRQTS
ncbi:hypothetical protein Back2_11890 [Nocardioides baekrokdamisoli]|uniref:Uncharacterized protein n=1 Tax=Nocardioides baekrokdamisoli TaxID=1804624 RepID=A0A3G9IF27_9ACTN|nr:hypothetical protein Back2_11890 [Nocardioides baekrokdamisoli]